ncbi:MAG: histidine phosphatase family protein [Burkholderiales bacterium]|nr:MAG: histidine phosphatase family protein [Burkholderiales bacterium]
MKTCLIGLLLCGAHATGWAWELKDGDVVLYRHALAPGGGDPPGFKLGDCSTQRNLSDAGRVQARQIGEALRQRLGPVPIGAVWASPWCRTLETARLAFPAVVPQPQGAFASFFERPEQETGQLAEARRLLDAWRGPGVLVVVTHQVNVTGLSGVYPSSGEGVALRPAAGQLAVLGRLDPPPAP